MNAVHLVETAYRFKVAGVVDLTGMSGWRPARRVVIRPHSLTVSVDDSGRVFAAAEGRQVRVKDGSLGGIRSVSLGYDKWSMAAPPDWAQEAITSLGLSWEPAS